MTGPQGWPDERSGPAVPAGGSTATGMVEHACEPVPSGDVSGTPASSGDGARGTSRPRLVGIDAARGLALLGMMAVHTIDAYDDDGTLSLAWTLSSGKSAALFALLAGVGVAFASGGRRRPTGRRWTADAASLAVRALLIGAVGLALGFVVPSDYAAVILAYYALLFLFAIPLLSLSIRTLVVLAGTIAVVMPVLSHLLRAQTGLSSDGANPTFADLLADPLSLLGELALTGVYPALPWLAYLCAGLAVGRSMLSSRRTVLAITLVGAGLVVGARTVSWLLLDVFGGRAQLETAARGSMTADDIERVLWSGTTPADTGWWLATMAPHSSTPLDILNTIGIGLVVLGICILIGRTTTALLRPLAAAGSMTLTIYSLHLLMLSAPGFPGGDLDGLLLQLAVVVAFALVWSRFHARGPLEELVAEATGAVRRTVLSTGRSKDADARERA
ncbi:heparan-alpha-glucosaminide N-acetyltransferase domain-containing protein [Blastococcus sp. HT6-30]|uniref:heparan-alpha-glucosaminide N-acetyltransferase domain-containing protein n=1 Tax=Blastococcus sp. HT6-30 TaxID=3144843 RepID=UPI00321B1883